ncbi:leucine-rich repeat-containing protein 46-like isoform X2 [Bolinopsis microptera]|uniref:leucine-rich repeat-containing protein 46-like isoform X2 n=1 Tax=Bolinopsis microptera TaxID=2820187 RepID=UPI0030797608
MAESLLPKPINLEMIVSKNCSDGGSNNSVEDSVLRLKRIWLDKMGITQIDNLEMLGNITHIHLDFNVISTIENLETVGSSLQHLSLKGNKISDIGGGLMCLSKLMSLDLSENRISTITSKQLPSSITFLNLLDNPLMESNEFDEDSFLEEFPEMKVYNKNLLNDGEDSDEEVDEEADENESETGCLQDMTRNLKESSKARQNTIEENHQNKKTTLALLKTELTSAKPTNNFSRLEHNEKPQQEASELSRNCLPPLERTLSSQSLSKKPGLLDPLPLRRTSSPSISRLKSPQTSKLADTKQVPRLNSPKRIPSRTDSGAVNASLRQPLEMELVKADGFEEYLVDVNKKFSDLRTEFKGM